MIDNVNPTEQFHPYQPPTHTPASELPSSGGLGGFLRRLGVDRTGIEKARTMARDNSGLVLGGLAALAIGAGLLRRRSLKR